MAEERTTQQVREHYLREMGTALGEQFDSLQNRTAWCFCKWEMYVELFGHSPERVEFLNRTAPGFFHAIQSALLDDTLMHIARLTDPAASAGKANLTIMSLPGLVDSVRDKGHVAPACRSAMSKADFCRELRNKVLAHNDLDVALGRSPRPLAAASRMKVWAALKSIAAVLNLVSNAYDCGTIAFEHVQQLPGGTAALLRFLKLGRAAYEEQLKNRRRLRGDGV